jgi:hypothetical protein
MDLTIRVNDSFNPPIDILKPIEQQSAGADSLADVNGLEPKNDANAEKNEDALKPKTNLDANITNANMHTILDAMKKQLQGRKINKSSILRVTYDLLSVTRNLKNGPKKMPGPIKKNVLLFALRKLMVDEDKLSEDDRELVIRIAADACDVLVEAMKAAQSKCCVVS